MAGLDVFRPREVAEASIFWSAREEEEGDAGGRVAAAGVVGGLLSVDGGAVELIQGVEKGAGGHAAEFSVVEEGRGGIGGYSKAASEDGEGEAGNGGVDFFEAL